MTYTLLIGDRSHSSWSMRGWLLFRQFGIPVTVETVRMYTPDFAEALARFSPARTVPAIRTPEGAAISESLAIAEELAARHPDAGLWPTDPARRATARMLAAEMHAGFHALREACPMNLKVSYAEFPVSDAVRADLDRCEALWAHARAMAGPGPWLFGAYSAADAFFAPVAARIAGYGLSVGPEAAAYVARHLADPGFRQWRAMGIAEARDIALYDRPHPHRPWPGPAPLAATAVAEGPAENTACPYSGRPVTHFLAIGDRVFGFCNPFCRDKTVADPGAWPAFAPLLERSC